MEEKLPESAQLTVVKREPRPYGDEFLVYAVDEVGNVWCCTETRDGYTGDAWLHKRATR